MPDVRFIHAADLHLDAAFRGLAQDVPAELATRLHEATFTALARLVALCEKERPDFLLLAGDVYNQEDRSVRAQLALRDGCVRLEAIGVRVFIAHGNHDPYPSRLTHLNWPANVTLFGEEVESHPVLRDGELIAMIHGVSHASAKESRNLATRFARSPEDCLHVGVLHTSLGGVEGETRYAPCAYGDLAASGLDYWALGHVHQHTVAGEKPLAVYPGALQGLHVNETGDKGCLMVTATAGHGGWTFAVTPKPLAPLRWEHLDVALDEVGASAQAPAATLDELDLRVRAALDSLVARLEPHTERLVVRLRLTGRSALDGLLRTPAAQADLLDLLRQPTGNGPLIWIKDVQVQTRPAVDQAALRARDDLLGEITRLTDNCRTEPVVLQETFAAALGELYEHARARKVLVPLGVAEQQALLDAAESLCVDLLETR